MDGPGAWRGYLTPWGVTPWANAKGIRSDGQGVNADHKALAVDLTARNVQDAVKAKGLPWSTAKGFDTFCPVGYVFFASPLNPLVLLSGHNA